MLHATEAPPIPAGTPEFSTTYLAAYRWMLLARMLEEKIASLYRGGKITGGSNSTVSLR